MLRIIMIGTVEWWSGAVCASPPFVLVSLRAHMHAFVEWGGFSFCRWVGW